MRNLDLTIRGWIAKGAHQARQRRWCYRPANGQRSGSNGATEQGAIKGNSLFLLLLQYVGSYLPDSKALFELKKNV